MPVPRQTISSGSGEPPPASGGAGPNWQGGSTPTFNANANIVFYNTASQLSTLLVTDRTIGALTFNDNADANVTVRFTTANIGNAVDLTMGSGGIAPSINVSSGSEGNHRIGSNGNEEFRNGVLILLNNLTVNHDGTGTLTINRPITESGGGYSVTKNGAGTLILEAANTYTGGTVINGGTVVPVLNTSLGTGTVTINSGGTLDINNRNLSALPFILNGGTVINTTGWPQNAMRNVTLTADSTFGGTARFDIRPSGGVNATIELGGHTLTKEGTNKVAIVEAFVTGGGTIDVTSGILGLTRAGGAGSFENVTIKVGPDGTLEFENNSSRGSYAANLELSSGNVLVGGNPATVTGTITLEGSNTFTTNAAFTAAGQISGAGNLIKTGGGTMTLSSNNTYTGTTTINGGTLQMASNVIQNSPTIFIGNGATLNVTGANSFVMAANQAIEGTGATGTITTGTGATNGLVMTGGNTISTSGALSLQRLEIRGTGNEMTGGNITSGINNSRRGLLVGNTEAGTFTISGGTFTSLGGTNQADTIGTNNAQGHLIIAGGNYVNAGELTFGIGGSTHPGGTFTVSSGSATIGTLRYNSGTATGNFGRVNLDGGTLTLNSIQSQSGAVREFNFNGGQFVAGAGLTFDNTLTLNVRDGGALIDTNGFAVAINGNLLADGTGGLTKTGANILTLAGTNTFTGATNINQGAIAIANTGALNGTSAINLGTTTGGILQFNVANTTITAPITVANAGLTSTIRAAHNAGGGVVSNTNIDGAIGGAGNLVFTTQGGLGNTFSRFTLNAASTYEGTTTITTDNQNNNLFIVLGTENALPTTTVLNLLGGNGSGSGRTVSVDLNGHNQTLAGLTNTIETFTARNQRVTNSSGDLATLTINNTDDFTFGGNGIPTTFNGNPVNPTALITGNLALAKEGDGTFTLISGNTYTGGTTVSGGTLLVNNTTGSGTGSGAVTVNNGGTLGGTGFISGPTLINSGGILSPGNSGGTIGFGDGLTLNPGAILFADILFNGTTTDLAQVAGGVSIGGAILDGTWGGGSDNIFRGTYSADNMFWLINNQDQTAIDGRFANTTTGAGFAGLFGGEIPDVVSIDGQLFAAFYNSQFGNFSFDGLSGGNDFLLIAIPEPSRAMLLALALGSLLLRRRR